MPEDAPPDGLVALDSASVEVTDALIAGVEAVLFACGEPVSAQAIAEALELEDAATARAALAVLAERLSAADRGLHVARVAAGWQLRTDEAWAAAVLRVRGDRPVKLSQAALEVLSIVAWRQPVTRSEIDAVRGVRSGAVLRALMERGLVRSRGRSTDPGRPIRYGTTAKFLETYELPDLRALPDLDERRDLE